MEGRTLVRPGGAPQGSLAWAVEMRSLYADKFNHDADAAGYDADVRNESDPIRAGYAAPCTLAATATLAGLYPELCASN